MKRSGEATALLEMDFLAHKLYPAREYRFDPKRRWRWDYCWPDKLVAVEVDGGTYSGGRHTTGKGHRGDCEKRNAGVLAGWKVLTFSSDMVRDGAVETILEALGAE